MRLLSRGWRGALATRGFARRKIARARAHGAVQGCAAAAPPPPPLRPLWVDHPRGAPRLTTPPPPPHRQVAVGVTIVMIVAISESFFFFAPSLHCLLAPPRPGPLTVHPPADLDTDAGCLLGDYSQGLCTYSYVVVGVAFVAAALVSLMQCSASRLFRCGMGPKWADVLLALLLCIWWALAVGVIR